MCALIPLERAMLCANCDMISSSSSHVCPQCGSSSLLSLANTLGTLHTEREIPTPLTQEGADNHGSPSHIAE